MAPIPQFGRVLLVAGLAAAGLAAHASDHWLVGESPHFEMYSDETEAESRRILVGLEEFRVNFLHLVPLEGASEPRATIVVFNRESEFRPYKPLYQGKPRDLAGYFLSRPDEVVIAMTTDIPNPDQDPRTVIYHEYVHLLMDAREAHYPLWLNEGLAEVFSTFKVEDGKVEYGDPIDHHVALLQRTPLWPLPRLFAVGSGSPDYNEDSRTGIFYAESWAFTHYLLFGADRSNSDKLNRFARHLVRGDDIAYSFHESFGLDFATQETALRRYLSGGGYIKTHNPALAQNVPLTFRPASDLERDAALLNLRWRVRQNPDAAAAAYALLQKDPTPARPHELLAAIAASSGDMATAQEHWRAAAERKSQNPWVYLQLLRETLGSYEGTEMLDLRLSPEVIAPLRSWAGRAKALSPENREALEDVLTVEAIADQMDVQVINRTQSSVRTMRDPAKALLALAIIHWRGDQPESARSLVNLSEAQPRADMATRAAANALRYRLPPEPDRPVQPEPPAGSAAALIALQIGHVGDAARFLDSLLIERGSTAPRVKLDRYIARASARTGPSAWDRADEVRQRAQAGDANAMFDLAADYACGTGVEFSPALAQEWLQQATAHGHPLANPTDTWITLRGGARPPSLAKAAAGSPGALDVPTTSVPLTPDPAQLPPLDETLAEQIAAAATASDRHPPIVIYRSAPRFPPDLERRGGKGEAVVRFTIRADGHPGTIQAADFSDPASAAAAEECVRGWRFLPTIRDGKPVATRVEMTFAFEVPAPHS